MIPTRSVRFEALRPIALVAVFLLSSSCAPDAPSEASSGSEDDGWAVVVGISQYDNFPTLESAVPRAESMQQMFETTWGVPAANMRVLLDGEATRSAIREALTEWLGSRVSEGDEVLVFLSGYGSTIEDISGDEEDGLDEGFCPADALAASYERDILDDSLSIWLDQLPSERVTLILEGQQFGQGDLGADHPESDDAAADFPPLEAMGVTRCGSRMVDG